MHTRYTQNVHEKADRCAIVPTRGNMRTAQRKEKKRYRRKEKEQKRAIISAFGPYLIDLAEENGTNWNPAKRGLMGN